MINGNKTHTDNLSKFDRFALWINNHVGTIEFTILCFVLVTIPLLKPSTQTVIFYISSGYLQLVLLPLIIMGGNIQAKHAEEVAEAHYKNQVALEKKLLELIEKK